MSINLASHFENMLHYGVSISLQQDPKEWWQKLRPRLTVAYIVVALILLFISGVGHIRLLNEVGNIFGGFFWAIDNTDGQIVIVSSPPQLPPLPLSANSLYSSNKIVSANGIRGEHALTTIYERAHDGASISYLTQSNDQVFHQFTRPAVRFTLDMWWENYGMALLAGLSWLVVGGVLLASAQDWSGAVEGLTLLPPAMLFLLYSHWGNVQQTYYADLVFQLLWVPAFALLGAAFIHLSLNYHPETLSGTRMPRLTIDGLPYLPLLALVTYELCSLALFKQVPTRPNLIVSLAYGAFGGVVSFGVGIHSLARVGRLGWNSKRARSRDLIPEHTRRRIGDLLTLWIGGVGLGFCLGVLPILLTGRTLIPLSMFYVLAAVYPLILSYAIRSLRLIDRLQVTLEQREEALQKQQKATEEQQKTAAELRQTNDELQQATTLLLHADAHLRSILSQRIHDQPKQQALRIRSLLAYWQHKLRTEAERDVEGRVVAQPVIDALGKIRKVSEELESDLRGLQLLVEDAYQRRSLGLKLHLEKLIREDLPMLHPESTLTIKADLWALDSLSNNLELTDEGTKIAEAISYTVTQALLNVYNHAGATTASVRAIKQGQMLEVQVRDDGRGFDAEHISPEKTSLLKAKLKAHDAGGILTIQSLPRPKQPITQPISNHGTIITLRLPLPYVESKVRTGQLMESNM